MSIVTVVLMILSTARLTTAGVAMSSLPEPCICIVEQILSSVINLIVEILCLSLLISVDWLNRCCLIILWLAGSHTLSRSVARARSS